MSEPVDPASAVEQVLEAEREWLRAYLRVYGTTAVVVGRWRDKGVNAGQPFDYAARYVSVWVKRDGEWRMVSDQSTPIGVI